ncbi:hypothetical protein AAG906_032844 [Vitis piasezkii]
MPISHNAWAMRMLCQFRITWSSWLPKAISSSFQLQIVHGLKRWILDFQSFKMVMVCLLCLDRASADRVMREVHSEFVAMRTNGARGANKNIKRILRKMVETSRDWSRSFLCIVGIPHFFSHLYRATPYSLVYGLIGDPRGKFRPSWSGPYVVRELTPEGTAWLTDLDGNQFSEPTNVDQLKKYYV